MRVTTTRKTTTNADGTRVTRTSLVKKPELEWKLQASAVRALRALPEFNRRFTLAADMASGRRGKLESVKAKATGLVPGEPDLRLYLEHGRLCLIEFKAEKGRESTEQVDRIALLDTLGFDVVVIKASTEQEAAAATVAQVRAWLDSVGSPAGVVGAAGGVAANDDETEQVGLRKGNGE